MDSLCLKERVLDWNSENPPYLALVLTLSKSLGLHFPIYHKNELGWKNLKILDKIDVWSFNLYFKLSQMKMVFNHLTYKKMIMSCGSTYLGWSCPIRHDQSRGSISLHLIVNLPHFFQQLHSFFHGHKQTHLYILQAVISRGNNPV